MTCCGHCRDAEGFFNDWTARRELRRYRRKGPPKSTQLLLEPLRARAEGATLLDVGGGIGAIQHELFGEGLEEATQVDASSAYLVAARSEAERAGRSEKAVFAHGDFVEISHALPQADLVTLDRVICCYPHLEALLQASMDRARRIVGLVYPRERWGTRMAMRVGNFWFRIRGSAFRLYLHSPDRVGALLREGGFELEERAHTFIWRVEIYRRTTGDPPRPSRGKQG
jgi:hypothetical protein